LLVDFTVLSMDDNVSVFWILSTLNI
jgi:hypothetical protein